MPVPAHAAHFAINADDPDRARRFYGAVFGWRFVSWGPPGFWMIEAPDGGPPGLMGSLQGRRPLGDQLINGFEVSIAVADVQRTADAVVAQGGVLLMPPTVIPTVGTLCWFRDPEGNVCGAMQYDARAAVDR
jgi:predicted enzyme related to lactoylglutathione lyase